MLSGQDDGGNNFFTLSNFFSPANVNVQRTFKPPCGRSTDTRLLPVTFHTIVRPRRRNKEQATDIVIGTYVTDNGTGVILHSHHIKIARIVLFPLVIQFFPYA